MSPRPGKASLLCAAAAPALTLWACGGDVVVQPIQVAALCPTQPVRAESAIAAPPDDLVDDFEGGSMALALVAGRNGFWVKGDDGTSTTVAMENSDRCAARGARAGHFAGSGFSSWGANFTAIFHPAVADRAVAYDASAYGGFSFWAAVGGGSGAPSSLDTPVGTTTTDTAWNGGVCTTCMDYHKTTVALAPEWRRFQVRFSDLHQDGWGVPQVPLQPDQLVGLIVWPTAAFDIWIDDVRLDP